MATQWLECLVSPGMFDSEVAVEISTFEGNKVSMFISRDTVQRDQRNTTGWIPVRLLDENRTHGLVELPITPVDGARVQKVERRYLRAG